MGVSYFSCDKCDDTGTEHEDWWTCDECSMRLCIDCAPKNKKGGQKGDCLFCAGEDATDYQLLMYSLGKAGITRAELLEQFRLDDEFRLDEERDDF